jgi:hypothetical protein
MGGPQRRGISRGRVMMWSAAGEEKYDHRKGFNKARNMKKILFYEER